MRYLDPLKSFLHHREIKGRPSLIFIFLWSRMREADFTLINPESDESKLLVSIAPELDMFTIP